MKIAIMTDVNAGLDYVGYDTQIPCLRSSVNFKDEVLVDGIDILADEFYERIKHVNTREDIPSTSAPAVGDIYQQLDKFIEEGYTDVIHFPISFELSATGPTVKTIGQEYEGKLNVHVVNTKRACYLQGFLAINAKKMVEEGASVEEIIERSNYLIENSQAYFVVQDLSYLVKNGRLSGAAGFFGGLLKIKPILELSKDGKIVSKEKVKTFNKAVQMAVDLILDEIKEVKELEFMLFHSVNLETIELMKQKVEEARPDIKNITVNYITPAVGAHIGAGVVGIGYFKL